MDNADARFLRVLRPVERHLFTEKILAAGVFLIDAGQHFHHGGLPGAVFSHQRHHLAGIDAEGSAGKRLHAGKALSIPFSCSKGCIRASESYAGAQDHVRVRRTLPAADHRPAVPGLCFKRLMADIAHADGITGVGPVRSVQPTVPRGAADSVSRSLPPGWRSTCISCVTAANTCRKVGTPCVSARSMRCVSAGIGRPASHRVSWSVCPSRAITADTSEFSNTPFSSSHSASETFRSLREFKNGRGRQPGQCRSVIVIETFRSRADKAQTKGLSHAEPLIRRVRSRPACRAR